MAIDMTVKFRCPHCQVHLEAGIKLMGTTGSCPNCGKEITVPEKDEHTPGEKKETATKE